MPFELISIAALSSKADKIANENRIDSENNKKFLINDYMFARKIYNEILYGAEE